MENIYEISHNEFVNNMEVDEYKYYEMLTQNVKFITDLKYRMRDKFNYDIVSKAKKVLVVYHGGDIDGNGIAVISEFIDKDITLMSCNVRADECYEYLKENLDDFDLCIIADLNFSEECAIKVDTELDISKLILLDHHVQSMFLNEYRWALVIPHDILKCKLSCGSSLFYRFMHQYLKPFKNTLGYILLENFVFYTSAYDTWFANDTRTSEISLKMNYKAPNYLNMLFKSNRKDYIKTIVSNLKNNMIIDNESYISIKTNERIVQSACSYMYNNCKICKFNNMVIAICFTNNYTSEIGDYILKKQSDIDVVAMIDCNTNRISLRSQNREDFIDVSEIAKLNGGNGHPNASGFKIGDTLPIYLIENILYSYFSNGDMKCPSILPIKHYNYCSENHNYIINEGDVK